MTQNIESSNQVDESVVSKMSTEIDERIQEAVSEKAEMEEHTRMVIKDSGMSIVDRGVKIAKIEGKIEAMVSIRAMIRSIGGQI